MQAHQSSLGSRAFGEHADSGLLVAYQSHQDALRFLSSALDQPNGIAFLQGPAGSGKTTTVREQLAWTSRRCPAALVEGIHLTPLRLLSDMLSQYGVPVKSEDESRLLRELNGYATRETLAGRPPVLILDDADQATSSALRLLNWLAALETAGKFSLRIILTGKNRLASIQGQVGMRSLARRHPAMYSLNPMTDRETRTYIWTRLIAAGAENVEKVFPMDVCGLLYEWSGGWPGAVNDRALEIIEGRTEPQAAKSIPRVIVTRDGETVAQYELTKQQYVIGRTDLADIVIEDAFVSKMHAMMIVYGNAIMLLDLNSTNGTTVNSRIGERFVLKSNDIIMLGRHRLKIENAPAITPEMDARIKMTDTITMAHLDDLRRSRARRTITALKHK